MAVAQRRPVLPFAEPTSLGLDPERIERIATFIEDQIAAGQYPGAQFALARHGKLAVVRSFGQARLGPTPVAASDETLWLMYSQTKVITASAIWRLVEDGALSFDDRIAEHIPEFAAKSKGDITLFQVLTHQAGYPNANVTPAAFADHALMRQQVCDFELQWWPGSKVHYHSAAAHLTCAVLIEAVTGRDYREFIRSEVLDPLGIDDIQVGVPEQLHGRCVDMHLREDGAMVALPSETDSTDLSVLVNTREWRLAGAPGAGGYGTAAGIATFYQMMLAGGTLNGRRLFSPRLMQFVSRNQTDERIDENFGLPMHRGIGPHVRGTTSGIRGLGGLASPTTFGHGGAGTSYSWADPESGLSFSYLSNCRREEPFHSRRIDRISNLAHATLVEC